MSIGDPRLRGLRKFEAEIRQLVANTQQELQESRKEIQGLKQAIDDNRKYIKEQLDDLRRTLGLIAPAEEYSDAREEWPICEVEDGAESPISEPETEIVGDGEQSHQKSAMEEVPPEELPFNGRQYGTKMNELLPDDGQDLFTSFDEVYDTLNQWIYKRIF